ncbi:hypothetical protein ACMA1I_22040, partial [Pontibacter sp. 13R65]|uniref:hypothetical protein n=1 Tax=Pontibacter sp. 13R65 TaxID=3127458 RepID=UPI00301D0EDE
RRLVPAKSLFEFHSSKRLVLLQVVLCQNESYMVEELLDSLTAACISYATADGLARLMNSKPLASIQ